MHESSHTELLLIARMSLAYVTLIVGENTPPEMKHIRMHTSAQQGQEPTNLELQEEDHF